MPIDTDPIPPPRRYEVDTADHSPAADYRAVYEKLTALGYDTGTPYERTMRALLELEHLRALLLLPISREVPL